MATVIINEERLSAIGDAIRAKTGNSELLRVADMPAAIEGIETGGGGGEGAIEIPLLTNDFAYWNYYGAWDWFINKYGDKITTENIAGATYAFYSALNLESLSFDFNFRPTATAYSANHMFSGCSKLTSIGRLVNFRPTEISNMFYGCKKLKALPEFVNPIWTNLQNGNKNLSNFCNGCNSLRSVPESLLRELYNKGSASYSSIYYNAFSSCFNLDEIRGIPTRTSYTSAITKDLFGTTFNSCYRLKEIIFDTDNGTPRQINWSNQTINLSYSIGYSERASAHTGNGISADKQVKDDVSYQALKNDPDWFTVYEAYSRYNHDSAVNTINSLPDVTVGSGNTIKFNGAAGSKTDGGAINTLTEEEIAVAAAKGWTVTFV